MKKRGHIIFAAILEFLFVYLTIYLGFSWFDFTWKSIAIISAIIVVYSILPDIDHKNSTITWILFGIGIIGLIVGIFELIFGLKKPEPLMVFVISTAILILTFVSGNFLKHRGIVHTIQVGLLASLPVYFLFHNILFPVLAYIAWHSHLIGDGLFFKIR